MRSGFRIRVLLLSAAVGLLVAAGSGCMMYWVGMRCLSGRFLDDRALPARAMVVAIDGNPHCRLAPLDSLELRAGDHSDHPLMSATIRDVSGVPCGVLFLDVSDKPMVRLRAEVIRWAMVLSAVSFAVVMAAGLMLASRVLVPIRELLAGTGRWARRDRRARSTDRGDEFEDLAETFNAMAVTIAEGRDREIRVRERTAELAQHDRAETELKKAAMVQAQRAEQSMLRYQLTPHFMLNSLNSIRELVLDAPETARRMILKLASFCRAALADSSSEWSTVGEEMSLAMDYLEIEKVRYGDKLRATVEVESGLEGSPIPTLIYQPLLENAIKHGRRPGKVPLVLRVSVAREDGGLRLDVANTGRWVDPPRDASGNGHVGLENLKRRLARDYGADARFTVQEEEGWVVARVWMPDRNV